MPVSVVKHEWALGFEWSTPLSLVVLAVATLTSSTPLTPVVVIVAALTLIATVSIAVTTGSGALTATAAAAGAGAAGWLAYAHKHSPWTVPAVASLALGWLALTSFAVISYAAHRQQLGREQAIEERERAAAELRKWNELLASVNIKGVVASRVVKTRAGHVVTYRLPKDGSVKKAALADAGERLEIAGLPDGTKLQPGSIRFAPGRHAGEIVMHVTERDVLADEIPYPLDLTPLTINEPFDVGWSEDGTLALIYFRELRLLVIGETGAGKTNLLHVIIAQLARCVDTIIFGIDLTGGTLLAPWVKPWIDKQSNRPVIDWPATDRAEAERLLASLLNVSHARARKLAGRDDKVKPSRFEPAYVLVVDELSSMFTTDEPREYRDKYHAGQPTPRVLSWLATQINNGGRKAAVDAIWATQRSTATHIPSNIKSQCTMRIGLGTSTVAEASNLAPDSPAMQKIMSLIRHAGTGVVWRKDKNVRADKFYNLPVERIGQIAAWAGDNIRPEPNEFDRAALGPDYASRWERLAPLLHEWSDIATVDVSQRTFEQVVAGIDDPHAALKDWQKRTLEIVGQAGGIGIRPNMITDKLIREGLGVDRATVQRFLREQAHEGFVENWKHGLWRLPRDDRNRHTGTDGA